MTICNATLKVLPARSWLQCCLCLQEIGRIYKSVVRELKLQEELGNKQVGAGGGLQLAG